MKTAIIGRILILAGAVAENIAAGTDERCRRGSSA